MTNHESSTLQPTLAGALPEPENVELSSIVTALESHKSQLATLDEQLSRQRDELAQSEAGAGVAMHLDAQLATVKDALSTISNLLLSAHQGKKPSSTEVKNALKSAQCVVVGASAEASEIASEESECGMAKEVRRAKFQDKTPEKPKPAPKPTKAKAEEKTAGDDKPKALGVKYLAKHDDPHCPSKCPTKKGKAPARPTFALPDMHIQSTLQQARLMAAYQLHLAKETMVDAPVEFLREVKEDIGAMAGEARDYVTEKSDLAIAKARGLFQPLTNLPKPTLPKLKPITIPQPVQQMIKSLPAMPSLSVAHMPSLHDLPRPALPHMSLKGWGLDLLD